MKFSDILNHDSAKDFLSSSMKMSRRPQSFLLTGKAGVGKATVALAIARVYNCQSEEKADCDSCPSCARILKDNHPDIQFIEKNPGKQFINIEQIRDIQYQASITPIMADKKAFIIRDAENMNPASANCLLKILEEPPRTSLLILTSSNPHLLLPTIKSRCVHLPLSPIIENEIADWLVEKYDFNREEASVVAALSDGSPGTAVELVEEDYLNTRNEILDSFIEFESGGRLGIFKAAYDVTSVSGNLKETLETMTHFYRDVIVWQITGNDALILNKDKSDEIKSVCKNYAPYSLFKLIEKIQYVSGYAYKRLNHLLAVEVLLDCAYELRNG